VKAEAAMISVASTLLLVSLVFVSVPSASAAPVGTRSMNVKEMRSMEFQRSQPVLRRAHHSAIAPVIRELAESVVPRTEDIVAAAVVARAGAPPSNPNNSNTTTTVQKMRRRHGTPDTDTPRRAPPRFKRDETVRRSVTPDAVSAIQARKEDATESNVARARSADMIITRAQDSSNDVESRDNVVPPNPTPTAIGKRRLDLSDPQDAHRQANGHPARSEPNATSIASTKREEVVEVADMAAKRDGPIRPIAMFRRALAGEDLD